MTGMRRTAVVIVAALALFVPMTSANAAWTWLGSASGGSASTCKTPVDGMWKVKLRVNANNATRRVAAGMTATAGTTTRSLRTGWVYPGNVKIVSFKLAQGRGWTIKYTIGTDSSGGGGKLVMAEIPRC